MARIRARGIVLCLCALALGATATAASAGASPGGGGKLARASIIGGANVADFSRWPYAVAVFRRGQLHCGGSVIAPTKVLTAAHCLDGINPANLRVVTGRPELRERTAGLEIGVAGAVAHPSYHQTQVQDIGVITLTGPTNAPPVNLPTPEEGAALGLPGQVLRVAGYGARHPFGFGLSKRLRETVEIVRTERRCQRAYRRIFVPQSMICALGVRVKRFGRPRIHTTACTGDSGGPLVADLPGGPARGRHGLLRRVLLRARLLPDGVRARLGLAPVHPQPALAPPPDRAQRQAHLPGRSAPSLRWIDAEVQAQSGLHADRRPAEGGRGPRPGNRGRRALPDPARSYRDGQDVHDGGHDRAPGSARRW